MTGPKVRTRWLGALALISAAVWVGGCNEPVYIPQTKIPDTPLNRELLKTMEKYRIAVEDKDSAAVLALAHPTYGDENGSPDPSDDIDYEELKKLLSTRFQTICNQRPEVR